MSYILALDQGTTSSRAILFDEAGAIVAVAQHEFQQFYPQPGWVEHDPDEILDQRSSACAVEALGMAGARPRDVAAIGITNQRETTVVWDRETGKPIHHAIVWQDRRTAASATSSGAEGAGEAVIQRRDRPGDRRLLLRAPSSRGCSTTSRAPARSAERGELAFGTIDTWLIWNLTSGTLHVTDVTNASRTMLFNILTGRLGRRAAGALRHSRQHAAARSCASSEVYGDVTTSLGLGGVPIAGIAGDQQAALFGQMCCDAGRSQEHLRHRLLHAAEHRHRVQSALGTA